MAITLPLLDILCGDDQVMMMDLAERDYKFEIKTLGISTILLRIKGFYKYLKVVTYIA